MAYSQLSFLLISFQIRLFNVPLLYPGQRMRQRSHLFRQCYDRFYCLAAKGTETKSPKDEFKIQNCAFSGQTADQHFYDRFFASQPRALGQSPENKLKIKNVFFSWLKQKMRDTQYFLRLLLQINNQIKIQKRFRYKTNCCGRRKQLRQLVDGDLLLHLIQSKSFEDKKMLDMTQSQMLQNLECTGGPIFKLVLEC